MLLMELGQLSVLSVVRWWNPLPGVGVQRPLLEAVEHRQADTQGIPGPCLSCGCWPALVGQGTENCWTAKQRLLEKELNSLVVTQQC